MCAFRSSLLGILGVCGLLTACAVQTPVPALPDPVTVFAVPQEQEGPSIVLGALEPQFDGRPVLPTLVNYPPPGARKGPRPAFRAADGRSDLPTRPQTQRSVEALMRQAAQEALVRPTAATYFGGGASTRYPYQPDRIYEALTNPDNPTVIRLPPGEHVMHEVVLDQRNWLIGTAVTGEGPTRQEAIIVQPLKSGLTTRLPLLCQSGRAYYVLLRSTDTLSMPEVTWQPSTLSVLRDEEEDEGTPRQKPLLKRTRVHEVPPAPKVAVDRVHTAWEITVTKGKPPWVPISTWDDGSAIIVVFRESLQYTIAPAAFVLGANGKPAIVETTPWEDGVPGHGAYYVVSGLYPVVLLKDGQGNEVRITRTALQPPPYREVSHAPIR